MFQLDILHLVASQQAEHAWKLSPTLFLVLCHAVHTVQPLCRRVRVLCPPDISSKLDSITSSQQALQLIASHGSSELGFLQFFNLHRSQPAIQQIVRDTQLAGTAAQLLGTRRVRLYQVRECK